MSVLVEAVPHFAFDYYQKIHNEVILLHPVERWLYLNGCMCILLMPVIHLTATDTKTVVKRWCDVDVTVYRSFSAPFLRRKNRRDTKSLDETPLQPHLTRE